MISWFIERSIERGWAYVEVSDGEVVWMHSNFPSREAAESMADRRGRGADSRRP